MVLKDLKKGKREAGFSNCEGVFSWNEGSLQKTCFSSRKFEMCGAFLFHGMHALEFLNSLNKRNAESRRRDDIAPYSRGLGLRVECWTSRLYKMSENHMMIRVAHLGGVKFCVMMPMGLRM
jgi:hypothetical protein